MSCINHPAVKGHSHVVSCEVVAQFPVDYVIVPEYRVYRMSGLGSLSRKLKIRNEIHSGASPGALLLEIFNTLNMDDVLCCYRYAMQMFTVLRPL